MTWVERLKSRDRRLTGLVAAMAIAVAVSLVVGYAELGVGKSEYQAELANTAGVRVGDEVRLAGVRVGEVTGLELAGDRILMSFEVEDDVVLGRHARVEVQLATLLGGRVVVLHLPDRPEPRVERISLANTRVPYDIASMVEDLGPTLGALDGQKIRRAVTSMNEALQAAEPVMGEALSGVASLTGVVAERREQIATLIRSAETMTELVNANSSELFGLMGQADRLLAELVERRALIRSLLSGLRDFTGRMARLFEDTRPELQPMLDNLLKVTTILKQADRSLDQALEIFPATSRYLTNMVGNGPYLDGFLPNFLIPDNYLCQSGAVKGCR